MCGDLAKANGSTQVAANTALDLLTNVCTTAEHLCRIWWSRRDQRVNPNRTDLPMLARMLNIFAIYCDLAKTNGST
jgi:hypothetical protein